MTSPRVLLPLLAGCGRALVRYGATSVGRTALAMASILLVREFLAGVLGGGSGPAAELAQGVGPRTALWIVAGLLVASCVGAALFKYDNLVVEQRLLRHVELGLMERLLRRLLGLSLSFYDRHRQGDLMHALRRDVAQTRTTVMALLSMLVEGMLAAGLFVAALWISPWTLLVTLVLLGAAFPVYAISKRTRMQSHRVRRSSAVLYDVVLQLLEGLRVIKVYRGEEAEAQRAVDRAREHFDDAVEIVRVQSLAQVVLESFAGISLVCVVVVGGFQVLDGQLGWPSLLAFLMAVVALHRPLNMLGTKLVTVQRNAASVERVLELLAQRPDVRDPERPAPYPAAPQSLRLEGVRFGYGEGPVLHGVDLEVRAGETVGVVGPSGAGKTTLLNLLARFYDPDEGRVLVDGRDLREHLVIDHHRALALVTQEPFLFATSVGDNIRCGRPTATDAEVERAARLAAVYEELCALPQGYDTVVGRGGRGLSAGQGQRLCVARALLKDAPIVLLDEPTANLDPLAEARVQQALERLQEGRTTVIVAHRLATVRRAARLYVLEAGRCIDVGTHDELLTRCATYRRMWEQQAGSDAAPREAPA